MTTATMTAATMTAATMTAATMTAATMTAARRRHSSAPTEVPKYRKYRSTGPPETTTFGWAPANAVRRGKRYIIPQRPGTYQESVVVLSSLTDAPHSGATVRYFGTDFAEEDSGRRVPHLARATRAHVH